MPQGSITVLLGRNGAGKTTTLRSIMGMTPPARRAASTLRACRSTARRPYTIAQMGIGYVPEHRAIFRELSVAREPANRRAQNGRSGAQGRFHLRVVSRSEAALSPARRQSLRRAAADAGDCARAGAGQPPAADRRAERRACAGHHRAVDERHSQAGRQTTVLLVEQNFRMASRLADHYVIIDDGQSPVSGAMADLVNDEALIQRYLGVA